MANPRQGQRVSQPVKNAFPLTRRQMLIGLAALVPAAALLEPTELQAAADGSFLQLSKVITGSDGISQEVADRIEKLLSQRVPDFESHLKDLQAALDKTHGGREQKLSALNDDMVRFALEIAKPWYLGYVGTPSDFVLQDDAAFATFLEAQGYAKIVDTVPQPTYPGQGPGWWGGPPPGVKSPAMPAEVVGWRFYPQGPGQIKSPDPTWRAYATAKYDNLEAARRARPATTGEAGKE